MSTPRPRIPESLRTLARTARRHGWTVTRTPGGHIRWKPPSGPAVITASTPGRGRANSNARARLRKAGLSEETS